MAVDATERKGMSHQVSAAATIETLAIVLAEQVKSGLDIGMAKRITREVCRRTYKQHHNQITTYDNAWSRFQGRIRKP